MIDAANRIPDRRRILGGPEGPWQGWKFQDLGKRGEHQNTVGFQLSHRAGEVDARLRTVGVERMIDDDHCARSIWEMFGQLDLGVPWFPGRSLSMPDSNSVWVG